jgi:methionyl-tRNA formyltransferase
MLKKIIIMGPRQFHEGLKAYLLEVNQDLEIYCIENLIDLMLLNNEIFEMSRLISFFNEYIIPPFILEKLKYGGVNFHPGLPSFPGHAPYSFAIYSKSLKHGVTAHEMVYQVDAGRIIAVHHFNMPSKCNYLELIQISIDAGFNLFKKLAIVLVHDQEPKFISCKWGQHKTTKAEYAFLGSIEANMPESEKKLRLRAFGPQVH